LLLCSLSATRLPERGAERNTDKAERYTDKAECNTDETERNTDESGTLHR